MNSIRYIIAFFFLLTTGCITQFIPETDEAQDLIVVEGLLTNQEGVNTIKLSKSMPLGKKSTFSPLRGCTVAITDDSGNNTELTENAPGIYTTNIASFKGTIGRKYTLHIYTNKATRNHFTYQSLPVEMKPVPQIDSVYYEKVLLKEKQSYLPEEEGCQVYLNTHDPGNNCKYFRWDYSETWEFRLPFSVPVNNRCWIINNSNVIHIKNISGLAENRINRYPMKFISNETDRLKERYSILINQYSLSEDEFTYWEKLQNISEEIGSLYDITPASIPGNIYCIEDPGEKVLGYFSVSAMTSERIFIEDYFSGIVNLYSECITDTIYGTDTIPDLNKSIWILEQSLFERPPFTIVTNFKGCADCTVRGSLIKPDFWDEKKGKTIVK